MTFRLWLCLMVSILSGANTRLYTQTYRLDHPDTIWLLPKVLEEISGLSFCPEERWLLAVQDEWGDLYGLNPESGQLDTVWRFLGKGDYEGVTVADTVVYVLRSDGSLYYSIWQEGPRDDAQRVRLPVPRGSDLEGLTWDPVGMRLLIAVKDQPGETDRKGFFRYDPASGERDTLLTGFDKNAFRDAIRRDLRGGDRKRLTKWLGKSPEFRLGPSGVAIHPHNGRLYMLSSRGNVLLELDQEGRLIRLHALDKSLFPQPEGIAFNRAGDLYIANEGKKHGKPGTVLVFRPQP